MTVSIDSVPEVIDLSRYGYSLPVLLSLLVEVQVLTLCFCLRPRRTTKIQSRDPLPPIKGAGEKGLTAQPEFVAFIPTVHYALRSALEAVKGCSSNPFPESVASARDCCAFDIKMVGRLSGHLILRAQSGPSPSVSFP